MGLTEDLARVTPRVALLADKFESLSQRLAATARDMAAGGDAPTVALIDELDRVRAEFADVRRAMLDVASAVGASAGPSPDTLTSLSALQGLVQAANETVQRRASEEAQRAARGVLEGVLRLRHRDAGMFPALADPQAGARQLLATITSVEWPAIHPEVADLAAGSHPFAHLLELARQPPTDLDDTRWELLRESVAANFSQPLAVAAARGKLAAVDSIADAAFALHENEDDWPTVTLQVREAPPPPGVEAPAPHAPDRDLVVAAPEAPHVTQTLVWQALLANRVSAAFQLASHLEREPLPAAGNCPPAWLVRALALSPHLLYVNGDLALQLSDAFAQFDADAPALSDADEASQAIRLLLAAAALRPALVAPDTAAWAVLRGLPEDPGFTNFRRYAHVIAEYGEHHPPLWPYLFAPRLSSSVWLDAVEGLLREVGAWKVRFLGMRPSFPPATDVWRCWLRPDGLVHTLLAPLTLEPRGLEAARGIADRLSNEAQIRWEIGHTDRVVLGRRGGADITTQAAATAELGQRIREAVAFARRWIALQDTRPGQPEDERRKSAQLLRQELSRLRPAVIQELEAAAAQADAPLPVRAAVGQCQVAVASVDSVLATGDADPNPWSRLPEEPPAGVLLSCDVFRTPGLQLDEGWAPQGVYPAQVARAVATMVRSGDYPAWEDAFAAHLRRHDHLATERVLQAIELEKAARGSSDLPRLRLTREEDLQQCREALRREVDASRQYVDAAAAQGGLSEFERTASLSAVEGIALGVPDALQFEPLFARLRALRAPGEGTSAPTSELSPQDRPDGRGAQLSLLAALDGPCLLVASAGLGTSHMLRSVAEMHHAPDQGRVALLLDMSSAPRNDDVRQTDRFWHLLAESTHAMGIADERAPEQRTGRDDPLSRIQLWSAADPARQLLVLVDAADALLDEGTPPASATPEESSAFPFTSRLATCMNECQARVKFVLAGSLSAHRASRLIQHPLAHRGCVRLRPLLDGGGWREAHALLDSLVSRVRLASPAVSARLLSLANYEPASIVRLAGLLEDRSRGETPITLELLDELTASPAGMRAMTETLHATLDRDSRMAVVAYSLALGYWQRSSTAVEGASSRWLRDQAVSWWENGFRHTWSEDAFNDLLDDMVGLGLLHSVGNDRFVLGRPVQLPFLGSADELTRRLHRYSAPDVDEVKPAHEYAPASWRPGLAGGPAGRSPLTARQLSTAFGPEAGAVIVFGTPAAGVLQLERIHDLTHRRPFVRLTPPPGASSCEDLVRVLDAELAALAAGTLPVVLVAPEWAWSWDWVTSIADHLERPLADSGRSARVVFVADPATTLRLVETPAVEPACALASLKARGVKCVSLAPWRPSDVRQWLQTSPSQDSLSGIDPDEVCDLTGNWPLLLASARDEIGALESGLAAGIDGPLGAAFGLDLPVSRELLEFVLEGGSADIEVDSDMLPTSLEWALLLHLARPVGNRRWRLDPLVAGLLQGVRFDA